MFVCVCMSACVRVCYVVIVSVCMHVYVMLVQYCIYIPHRGYVHTVKTRGRMVIVSVGSVCALQIQSTLMEPVSTK